MGRSGTQRALPVQGDGRIVGTDTHTHRHTQSPESPGREAAEREGKRQERETKGGAGGCRPLAASHAGRGAGEQSPALGARWDVGAGALPRLPHTPTSPLPAPGPALGLALTRRPAGQRQGQQAEPRGAQAGHGAAAPRVRGHASPAAARAAVSRPPARFGHASSAGGGHGTGIGDPPGREVTRPPEPAQVARREQPGRTCPEARERLVGALQCVRCGGRSWASNSQSLLFIPLSFPPQGVPRRLWVALGTPAQERCPTSSSRPLGSLEINPARRRVKS